MRTSIPTRGSRAAVVVVTQAGVAIHLHRAWRDGEFGRLALIFRRQRNWKLSVLEEEIVEHVGQNGRHESSHLGEPFGRQQSTMRRLKIDLEIGDLDGAGDARNEEQLCEHPADQIKRS